MICPKLKLPLDMTEGQDMVVEGVVQYFLIIKYFAHSFALINNLTSSLIHLKYNHSISPVVVSILVSTLMTLGSVPRALQLSFLVGLCFAVKSRQNIW